MARAHLLDIDLRVRWTLKQSTFAAAVLAITFGLSEGTEMLVASELGDKWGLVAAVVALLFLKPKPSNVQSLPPPARPIESEQ